jgi:GH25 family lysozyme M1 (1,4-beta-N-acetylmuramidase)
MKTVKKNKEILRASNNEAEQLTKQGWKYCPKSEWRKHRDAKSEDDMFQSSKKKTTARKRKKLARKPS